MLSLMMLMVVVDPEGWMPPTGEGEGTPATHPQSPVLTRMTALETRIDKDTGNVGVKLMHAFLVHAGVLWLFCNKI